MRIRRILSSVMEGEAVAKRTRVGKVHEACVVALLAGATVRRHETLRMTEDE